jgi:hypothetical protein
MVRLADWKDESHRLDLELVMVKINQTNIPPLPTTCSCKSPIILLCLACAAGEADPWAARNFIPVELEFAPHSRTSSFRQVHFIASCYLPHLVIDQTEGKAHHQMDAAV